MNWTFWFPLILGGIALFLGLGCEWANFRLGRAHRRGDALRVSSVFLAPFFCNVFGLFMLFLGVHGYNVFLFIGGVILLFLLHIFYLAGGGI